MHHLNVRVAWHDSRWDGTVCKDPVANSFCVDLERIRTERVDAAEVKIRGKSFSELTPDQLPPCRAESAAFMNPKQWVRVVKHPYSDIARTSSTHGHLEVTPLKVPPYSTFAVPFYWMLRKNQESIDNALPTPLPPDEEPPFPSPWVFSRARQEALSELFARRLTAGKSLVFFYTKSGHPLEEAYSRLIVGVGMIDSISTILKYESPRPSESYPLWDRLFQHSIRPEGKKGFLLPYHDYLEPTGDPDEDERRKALLAEIAVVPEATDVMAYSYAGELARPDIALPGLVKCLAAVRRIRQHGIAKGPWEEREDWLNKQIAEAWQDRGAFPGAGAALEALGMRLGTSLVLELMSKGKIAPQDDPWKVLDQILRGKAQPPHKAYAADIAAVSNTWIKLSDQRRSLLRLLSRFSLSTKQAKRWFEPGLRAKAVRRTIEDQEILKNPYRIAELDLGDLEYPISMATIDRGVLPDSTVMKLHPLESPSLVESPLDVRRVRAGLVSVLRKAADSGDALLTEADGLAGLEGLDLARPCEVPSDWLNGNEEFLAGEVDRLSVPLSLDSDEEVQCVQLSDLKKREERLASILRARSKAVLPTLEENWRELLVASIAEGGVEVEEGNPRHAAALTEQAKALESITTRKLTVLVGRAGTGKTTVLGALLKSEKLRKGGVLFLAPTGKARVRLAQKANAEAMTVAQFLHQLKRYDGLRQRVLFEGKETYGKERTVVIDECSMLTMDDLLATFLALDLGHIQRVILVGDPNQLPPIGVGRPFADLVAYLDSAADFGESHAAALSRLSVELRTASGAPSDTLRLASWFTREAQPVDADRVLSDIELGESLNDAEVCFWKTPKELHSRLEEQFVKQLGLKNPDDIDGFNLSLGLTKEGWVPYDDHDGAENFQLLSPVRLHTHGVHALNRWIQQRYRGQQLKSARQPWGLSLGDEEIVWGDKVILTRNGRRDGWDGKNKRKVEEMYLANGEIGAACPATGTGKNKFLNVAFAGRPDVRFGFQGKSFAKEDPPLELAYVLTVHKAQGSEFGTVFMILPKRSRFLSRELVYTALTRSRNKLVLLIEGDSGSVLFDLANPSNSDTARRNTNLFTAGVRSDGDEFKYAAHLIHRTTRNEMVQSKSELAIANYFASIGLDYKYNKPYHGEKVAGRRWPDFTFVSDAGETILWEHLGMLDRDDYKRGWDAKKEWYAKNGFIEGKNLFTSTEGPGLDMAEVQRVVKAVTKVLSG